MHIAVDRLYTSKWEGLQSKNCEISVIGATAGVSLNKKGHSSPNYSPYTPPQKKPAKKKTTPKTNQTKKPQTHMKFAFTSFQSLNPSDQFHQFNWNLLTQ